MIQQQISGAFYQPRHDLSLRFLWIQNISPCKRTTFSLWSSPERGPRKGKELVWKRHMKGVMEDKFWASFHWIASLCWSPTNFSFFLFLLTYWGKKPTNTKIHIDGTSWPFSQDLRVLAMAGAPSLQESKLGAPWRH